MIVTFDPSADAAYIQLAPRIDAGGVSRTYPCDPLEVEGMINLDFDADGRLIGIEVLGATSKSPPELLAAAREL